MLGCGVSTQMNIMLDSCEIMFRPLQIEYLCVSSAILFVRLWKCLICDPVFNSANFQQSQLIYSCSYIVLRMPVCTQYSTLKCTKFATVLSLCAHYLYSCRSETSRSNKLNAQQNHLSSIYLRRHITPSCVNIPEM